MNSEDWETQYEIEKRIEDIEDELGVIIDFVWDYYSKKTEN